MSVANFHLTEDEIFVVSDTVAYIGPAPVAFTRKVWVCPHLHMAATTRGATWAGGAVDALVRAADSQDAAIQAVTAFLQDYEPPDSYAWGGTAEATLFRWAPEGPRVVRVTRHEDGSVDQYTYGPGVYLAPTLGKRDFLPRFTPEQWRKLCVVQQKHARKWMSALFVGGDMEATVIRADGIVQGSLGPYPDRAATEAEIRAYHDERGLDFDPPAPLPPLDVPADALDLVAA
ncbi:hypothetical protein [uncultured Rhodospira sp.]|uniref:hypothetical protein n=1 Tax=uncultured Rhodospira sp. TaxID=1936189 RepID=UPI00260BDE1F|nr:hypothetical protein [uncultured Rhodospira sp.]